MPATISINRTPVLTLWAAVVAQRLGIFKPHEEKTRAARERERGEQLWIELCGRPVPAKNTADGIRAVSGRAVVTAESAEAYLETTCGDDLDARSPRSSRCGIP